MKILLTIHHHLDPHSGAPGTVLKLGSAYEALGHEVDYYAFDHLPQRVQAISPEVVFPEFLAAHLLKQAHKYDVVDASSGDAWLWGSLRYIHRRPPVLITRSHGLEHAVHLEYMADVHQGKQSCSWKYPLYRGGFRLWEEALSLRQADLAFLLNQQDLKYAVKTLGVSLDRAHVTSNGIPEDFLNLPMEPFANADDNSIGIAQIGTYIPRKGIQYGIPALNAVLSRHPKVTVSLLGTGCPVGQVLADISPTLRNRVRVIPHFKHEQLPNLLKKHQIKLFTPLSEGFGKALVEAMACGLAPVTTAASGPLDIVRHEHDAIVVPMRNQEAIEQALEHLITDTAYLDKIRYQAYVTAQNYGWKHLAKQRLDLYTVAKERSSRRKQISIV
ncbi:MAG: glycosyltransferase family 4 protein [Cyanobacteria bacterium J06560_5]